MFIFNSLKRSVKNYAMSVLLICSIAVAVVSTVCLAINHAYSYFDEKNSNTNILNEINDASVTILYDTQFSKFEGSGVLIKAKDSSVWVLTAAHVIANARYEVKDQNEKTSVRFDDIIIQKQLVENGRNVGKIEYYAEVVRYSSINKGQDLALLRIRSKNYPLNGNGIKFYKGAMLPPVGCAVWHVGSLLGQFGHNSTTDGIISQHGRLIGKDVYDQTTCTAFPGSSGGGVYLKSTGEYVGMIVRGVEGGFNLIIPVRRIHSWAKAVEVDFIFDNEKDVPDNKKLFSRDIEDVLVGLN